MRKDGLIVSRQGVGNFIWVTVKCETEPGYTRIETIANIQLFYQFRLKVEVDGAELATQRRNQAAHRSGGASA